MACIIIEGPDGSGKTFTADAVSSAVNLQKYPTQGPPKSPSEIVKRIMHTMCLDDHVFDRFPLISEMVYGPILRNDDTFSYMWLDRLIPDKYIVVYCRPSIETILENSLKTKPHKSADHISSVINKWKLIIDEYDWIMDRIDNKIIFNRDNQTLEELCAGLILRLERIR